MSGAAFLVRGALMNMSNPLYSAFTMEQVAEREPAGGQRVQVDARSQAAAAIAESLRRAPGLDPAEIASIVAWLASEDSGFTTGAAFAFKARGAENPGGF